MCRREQFGRFSITIVLVIMSLLLVCNDANAQRIDVKGVRKRSKAADCATIVFKSDFDSLTVNGTSQDSIYKTKDCELLLSAKSLKGRKSPSDRRLYAVGRG